MLLQTTDFNNAGQLVGGQFQQPWLELNQVLSAMPLHLKASDQKQIKGRPIFDPVGTNEHIAARLTSLGWSAKIGIPPPFSFLGTDVDFGKSGLIVEVQFSNYPFLLNNTLRSELFFRAGTVFHQAPTGLVVIITKGGMFPSSNSTLYYEQAMSQLSALASHQVFTVPIRLVGLFEALGTVNAMWTKYKSARYSRTVLTRTQRAFSISQGKGRRCNIS